MPLTFVTELLQLNLKGEDQGGIIPTDDSTEQQQICYQACASVNGSLHQICIIIDFLETDTELCIWILSVEPPAQVPPFPVGKIATLKAEIIHGVDGELKTELIGVRGGSYSNLGIIFDIAQPEYASKMYPCGHMVMRLIFTLADDNLTDFLTSNHRIWFKSGSKPLLSTPCDSCNVTSALSTIKFKDSNMGAFHGRPFEDPFGESFTNFKILADGRAFDVHKDIIAMESDVFFRMLTTGLDETKQGYVDVKGVTSDDMDAFLTVLYDRGSVLKFRNDCRRILGIHRLAHKYEIADIVKISQAVLSVVPVDLDCFCELVDVADLYDIPVLMRRVAAKAKTLSTGFLLQPAVMEFAKRNTKAMMAFSSELVNLT